MRVHVYGARTSAEKRMLARFIHRVARSERKHTRKLSIVLVSNPGIQRLNRLFLHRNQPTDVMAFPVSADFLGEIYISRDQARIQAHSYDVPLRNELLRLALHGYLHLLGYSHRAMKPFYARYLESGR